MTSLIISIFGNKAFSEILNEMKLFSKYKIKYYEDFNLCVKDAEKQNLLVIFFVSEENKSFFNEIEISYFPSILISKKLLFPKIDMVKILIKYIFYEYYNKKTFSFM